jgi:hypothetical protein
MTGASVSLHGEDAMFSLSGMKKMRKYKLHVVPFEWAMFTSKQNGLTAGRMERVKSDGYIKRTLGSNFTDR